ncbi:MAG: hypothetical protein ABSA83_23755 [Verrucomicrobiota bacterium]|jgi:hypothetical protein
MTWRELSDFLNLQRRAIVPRPISEFARIGEKAADTFERLEKETCESLGEAILGFAKTKNWPALSDEQTVMLYFRLSHGVDLAMALSTCTTNLFPPLENRDSEMIQWALNEAWDYPGLPRTLRAFSEKRGVFGNEPTRN